MRFGASGEYLILGFGHPRHLSGTRDRARVNRRRLLVVGASTAGLLAGCSGRPSVASPTSTSTPADSQTPVESSTPTDSPTPTDGPDVSSNPTPRPAPHLGPFVLWNDDDERHRVTLTVSDDSVVVDETRDLSPGDAADVENPIETQGVYTVVARVDGEKRAERTWRVERCASVEYLQLYVGDAGRVELRTMRQTVDPQPTCG
jgi:hypothetical protein